jgi:hypothetical protein
VPIDTLLSKHHHAIKQLTNKILDSPKLISKLESDVAVTDLKLEDYATRTMKMMATPFFMAGTMRMSFDLKFIVVVSPCY